MQGQLFEIEDTRLAIDSRFRTARRLVLDVQTWIDVVPGRMTGSRPAALPGSPVATLTAQHICNTLVGMKTAILPQVRVEPQLRTDLEAVLREGETLSDFLEAAVRQAVDFRRMQAEFDTRADTAWVRFLQTGAAVPASEVLDEMRGRLESRRRKLKGKGRPTGA